MTRHSSDRATSIMAVLVFVTSLVPACSDDTPVNTGRSTPPVGQTCFDYADFLHGVSFVRTTGSVTSVEVADGMAYTASSGIGLQIIDFGDPDDPILRGAVATSQPVLDVAGADSVVCAALGSAGLAVIDVKNPDRPVVVGNAGTPGGMRGIAVVGSVAYAADDIIGLLTFDIGDPEAPTHLGTDNTPGRAVDVAVAGVFAYVADEVLGLRVVNVENPASPWLVNTVPMPEAPRSVAIGSGFACLAVGGEGLQVVDISSPGRESVVGTVDTRIVAHAVAVRGAVVFVAEAWGGVKVVDASDPSEPNVINRFASSGVSVGIAVDGDYAYVAESAGGLHVVKVDRPAAVPVEATMPVTGAETVELLAAGSGIVFGVGKGVGFFSVEPGGPILTPSGSVGIPYEAVDLAVGDGFAYVAAEPVGIEIIDVRDPSSPASAGWVPYLGKAVSLEAAGDVLYFGTGETTFGVYLAESDTVVTVDIAGAKTAGVAVRGDYAYVADVASRIHVVDVADTTAPGYVSSGNIGGKGEDVIAGDDNIYIITSFDGAPDSRNGVAVYGLQIPTYPLPVSFVEIPSVPYKAALAGDALYLATGYAGLVVVDVSDPANPARIGSVPSSDAATGVAVFDGTVFVADGGAGLYSVPAHSCTPIPFFRGR
jgi:hypothetical protein